MNSKPIEHIKSRLRGWQSSLPSADAARAKQWMQLALNDIAFLVAQLEPRPVAWIHPRGVARCDDCARQSPDTDEYPASRIPAPYVDNHCLECGVVLGAVK